MYKIISLAALFLFVASPVFSEEKWSIDAQSFENCEIKGDDFTLDDPGTSSQNPNLKFGKILFSSENIAINFKNEAQYSKSYSDLKSAIFSKDNRLRLVFSGATGENPVIRIHPECISPLKQYLVAHVSESIIVQE